MRQREIKTALKNAMNHLPHTSLDEITALNIEKLCEHDYITCQKSKSQTMRRVAIAVLCCAIFFVVGCGWYCDNLMVDSSITINVNPSFEIATSRHHRVLNVKALNDDAIEFVSDKKFRRWTIDEAVEELFVQLGNSEYISSENNKVVIYVDSKDEKHREYIERELTEHIGKALANVHVKPNVIFKAND